MIPFLIPLLGAGLGAIANKKDPLEGALMGGALGAAGGALAPGLLGSVGGAAAGAAGAAPAMANGAFLGEGAASGVGAWDGLMGGGLLSNLKTAGDAVAPVAKAYGAAQQTGLLGGQEQPIQAPMPMQQVGTGSQIMASLAQGNQQATQELQAADQARKQRRRGLLGMG